MYPYLYTEAHQEFWYLKLAQGLDAGQPQCYRWLAPWLVRVSGIEPRAGFWFLNIALSILAAYLFYFWLKKKNFARYTALAISVFWILLPNSPLFTNIRSITVDPLAICLTLGAMIAIERKNWFACVLAVVAAVNVRESGLVISLYALWKRGWFSPLILGGLNLALLYYFISPIIPAQHYLIGTSDALWTVIRNPFNIPSGLWMAFGPLGYLWFKGYGQDEDLDFLVWLQIFPLFFGGADRERFLQWIPVMIPLAWIGFNSLKNNYSKLTTVLLLFITCLYINTLPFTLEGYWLMSSAGHTWPFKVGVTALALVYCGALAWLEEK